MVLRMWSGQSALLIAAAVLWLLPGSAHADVRVNPESYPGTFEQLSPSIAHRGDGDLVVAWCDQRAGAPQGYLQWYRSGVREGSNQLLDEDPLYIWGNWWVGGPEIAMNGSGMMAVVAPTQHTGMENHVALWLFASDGSLIAGPIQVSDAWSGGGGDYEPFDAAVDINDAGQICVAWQENREYDLYARWIDPNGAPASEVVCLTSGELSIDSITVMPPVAVELDNEGRAVVSVAGSTSSNATIRAWLLGYGSIEAQSVAIETATYYATDSLYSPSRLHITKLADGSIMAAWNRRYMRQMWESGFEFFGSAEVVRKYDAAGNPVGPANEVLSSFTYNGYHFVDVHLAAMGDELLLVGHSGRDSVFYGQRLSLDGSVIGEVITYDPGPEHRKILGLLPADRGDGTFAMVWHGEGADQRGDIMMQVFNKATGQAITEPQRVHDDLGSNQTGPDLALGDGTVLAVWVDDRTSVRQSVWGRRLWPSGEPIGDAFQISQQTDYWIRDVKVAGNGTGQAVVVWTAWKNDGYVPEKVYAQILGTPNFTPVGNNIIVSDAAYNSSDFDADVAVADDNTFVVVYRGTTIDSWSARPYDVYLRRFAADGSPLTATLQVNSGEPDSFNDDFDGRMSPSIAMRPDGSFGVVWTEGLADVADPGIYPVLQLYTSDASPIGGNMQASDNEFVSTARSYVAVNDDNQWAIGFTGTGAWANGVNMMGPWVQVIDSLGQPLCSSIKMNIGEPDNASSPAVVAAGPNGDFVVVYHRPKEGAVSWEHWDFDIWACRFSPGGNVLGTRRMINSDNGTTDQKQATVVMVEGGALIAWEDLRDLPGNTDVYARLVAWDDLTAQAGDVDLNGSTNISDLTYLVSWLFRGGAAPMEPYTADLNGDGKITVTDITAMVQYLF